MKLRNILIIFIFTSLSLAEEWVTNIYNNYANAVVVVIALVDNGGLGSGFIIDKTGLVVTNFHVVEDINKIPEIGVVKLDGSIHLATDIIAYDKDIDFVIFKIEGDNHETVKLGDSDEIQMGDDVVALGHPKKEFYSLTKGIISQIRTKDEIKYFQHDSSIEGGSSGGPLFNNKGKVIGINTLIHKYRTAGDLGYAIVINYITNALKQNNITLSTITDRGLLSQISPTSKNQDKIAQNRRINKGQDVSAKSREAVEPSNNIESRSSILCDINVAAQKQSINYHQAKKQNLVDLKLDPKNSTAYLDLGITLLHLQSNYEAIDNFNLSIDLKPTNQAYYYRALAKGKLGKHYEMCADLRRADRLNHRQSKNIDDLVKKYCK